MADKPINGRTQRWGAIVTNLRELGLIRNDFSGQVSVWFHEGRPLKYELREVQQFREALDNRCDRRLDSG